MEKYGNNCRYGKSVQVLRVKLWNFGWFYKNWKNVKCKKSNKRDKKQGRNSEKWFGCQKREKMIKKCVKTSPKTSPKWAKYPNAAAGTKEARALLIALDNTMFAVGLRAFWVAHIIGMYDNTIFLKTICSFQCLCVIEVCYDTTIAVKLNALWPSVYYGAVWWNGVCCNTARVSELVYYGGAVMMQCWR